MGSVERGAALGLDKLKGPRLGQATRPSPRTPGGWGVTAPQ